MALDDLDGIAAELYALAPEEFTGARNAKAKEAKQAGDKELASAITALGKPTMVGWLANQLIREYPDEMNALLDLGASLREATASLAGDQLKELSRQQRQVVYALVQQARGLANAAGRPASEATARGLEETLHAALADPDVAAQLAAGRVTGVLSRSGFPGASSPSPMPAASGRRAPAAAKPDDDTVRRQAEQDEQEARSAAAEAAEERDRTAAALDDASAALTDAEALLEDLKRQLSEAGEAHVHAQRRVRSAREAAERADRLARRTAQRLADAEERTRRLSK